LVVENYYLEKEKQPPFKELQTWKSTLVVD